MYWHDNGSAGWGVMILVMFISWLSLAALTYLVARSVLTADRVAHRSAGPTAAELLDQRLARGEIDTNEYRTVKRLLDQPVGG